MSFGTIVAAVVVGNFLYWLIKAILIMLLDAIA